MAASSRGVGGVDVAWSRMEAIRESTHSRSARALELAPNASLARFMVVIVCALTSGVKTPAMAEAGGTPKQIGEKVEKMSFRTPFVF